MQSVPTFQPERLDRYIIQHMEMGRTPGIALALLDRKRIVRISTYGFSDLELQTPLGPGHLFGIGSITKMFTAIAVLQAACLHPRHSPAHGQGLPPPIRRPPAPFQPSFGPWEGTGTAAIATPDPQNSITLWIGTHTPATTGRTFPGRRIFEWSCAKGNCG